MPPTKHVFRPVGLKTHATRRNYVCVGQKRLYKKPDNEITIEQRTL